MDSLESVEMTCKFVLLVLLTQLGKTFMAITRILTELDSDEEHGRSIHVIFTMNTLLNNRQFAKRLEKIEQRYGKGSIVIFASKNTTKYRGVTKLVELLGHCFNVTTCPKVVIMCSNEYRFEDGVEFIETLNANRMHIQRVFAYYDELHKYITASLRERIERIHNMEIVKSIVAMTATPKRIYQNEGFWSTIRMIQLDDFNDANYAGYKNMIWNCVDDFFPEPFIRPSLFDFNRHDDNTIGFIEHVLNRYSSILDDKTRVFIPAHVRRISHNRVRELVFERNENAVVVVLNGIEKTLTYKENGFNRTINLGEVSDDEVCKIVADKIISNNLTERALVFTGFLCVGMGQTLTHESLGSFTSAIISHLDLTNDEIYQLFGRLTGRMRNWGEKYVPTQIYCPTKIMNRCKVMEECARRIATEHNGEITSADDYISPMNEMGEAGLDAIENIRVEREVKTKRVKRPQPIEAPAPFDTIQEANEFLSNELNRHVNIRAFHRPAGSSYELSTRLKGYYKKNMGELLESDRLLYDWYKSISMGMGISSKVGEGQQYCVYPVYANRDTPPSGVKYYVRYLKPTAVETVV